VRSLVVGARGGLGAAISLALAARGDEVVLASRNEAGLTDLKSEIESRGGAAYVVGLDIRDEKSVDGGVDRASELMGGLDAVVASSGISPIYKPIGETTVEEWDRIFTTNTRGSFLLARAVGRHLLPAGAGALVFVTSIHEEVGDPRLAAYAASKGAVAMLVRSVALEWAPLGPRVNAVAPAYVSTRLTESLRMNPEHRRRIEAATPVGRIAEPSDVTGAVAFLTSAEARYITGTTLFVDGGWTAR